MSLGQPESVPLAAAGSDASFSDDAITLVSFNGEKSHVSELELPDEAWLGRMRARLEFARQCRLGTSEYYAGDVCLTKAKLSLPIEALRD